MLEELRHELDNFHQDREQAAAHLNSEQDEEDWEDTDDIYDEESKNFELFGQKVALSDVANMMMFSMNT